MYYFVLIHDGETRGRRRECDWVSQQKNTTTDNTHIATHSTTTDPKKPYILHDITTSSECCCCCKVNVIQIYAKYISRPIEFVSAGQAHFFYIYLLRHPYYYYYYWKNCPMYSYYLLTNQREALFRDPGFEVRSVRFTLTSLSDLLRGKKNSPGAAACRLLLLLCDHSTTTHMTTRNRTNTN